MILNFFHYLIALFSEVRIFKLFSRQYVEFIIYELLNYRTTLTDLLYLFNEPETL
jgi:hypothetical protein